MNASPFRSATSSWPALARFRALDARIGEWSEARGPVARTTYEFVRFGFKQAWACLFGGALLALIVGTKLWYPATLPLSRYDALFIAALLLQVVFLATRLETVQEAKVILIFHLIGTAMEIEKTAIGSWIYPEANLFRIGGVPLFSGFMYASVGSYLARVWRLFDFRFARHPGLPAISVLALAVYANFLADHWLIDLRIVLLGAAAALFARTTIYYKIHRRHRSMPLLLGFILVALYIWLAENLGTGTGAWLYPGQLVHWSMVPVAKLTSWFMLMIISYTLVAWVNGIRGYDNSDTALADRAERPFAGAP